MALARTAAGSWVCRFVGSWVRGYVACTGVELSPPALINMGSPTNATMAGFSNVRYPLLYSLRTTHGRPRNACLGHISRSSPSVVHVMYFWYLADDAVPGLFGQGCTNWIATSSPRACSGSNSCSRSVEVFGGAFDEGFGAAVGVVGGSGADGAVVDVVVAGMVGVELLAID